MQVVRGVTAKPFAAALGVGEAKLLGVFSSHEGVEVGVGLGRAWIAVASAVESVFTLERSPIHWVRHDRPAGTAVNAAEPNDPSSMAQIAAFRGSLGRY
jgi:hypothetical protein